MAKNLSAVFVVLALMGCCNTATKYDILEGLYVNSSIVEEIRISSGNNFQLLRHDSLIQNIGARSAGYKDAEETMTGPSARFEYAEMDIDSLVLSDTVIMNPAMIRYHNVNGDSIQDGVILKSLEMILSNSDLHPGKKFVRTGN
jgi:hypothetical protein